LKGVPGKYRFEGVVVVDEAVSDACLVNIEAARSAQPVDADNLSGSRARELFVLELLGGSQVNSLTIPELFLERDSPGLRKDQRGINPRQLPLQAPVFRNHCRTTMASGMRLLHDQSKLRSVGQRSRGGSESAGHGEIVGAGRGRAGAISGAAGPAPAGRKCDSQ
jgi:hypothetical protein